MSPATEVSREAMDGLADAILETHEPEQAPAPAQPDDVPYDEQVDGLATACLRVWADGEVDPPAG